MKRKSYSEINRPEEEITKAIDSAEHVRQLKLHPARQMRIGIEWMAIKDNSQELELLCKKRGLPMEELEALGKKIYEALERLMGYSSKSESIQMLSLEQRIAVAIDGYLSGSDQFTASKHNVGPEVVRTLRTKLTADLEKFLK